MKKILVVEDRDTTVHQLKQSLESNGYEVYIARRGKEALDVIAQHRVDLVLLDLVLPDISGLYICKELRADYPALPIIILSVKSDEREKVRALNLCADDYVSKPYYTDELLARINVQFLHTNRMRSGTERRKFTAGPLEVNFAQRRVKVDGQEIDLTFTEFELLKTLVTNSGKIVTYDFILSKVWDDEDNSERKNIHVYINRLRKKIETPAQCRFIYNEAKVGYRFQADHLK
jgi:two-component system, OmpR family, KDP operon response regulator KdpE